MYGNHPGLQLWAYNNRHVLIAVTYDLGGARLLASGMFLVHGIYTCIACRLGYLVSHIQIHIQGCEAQTGFSLDMQRFRISTCGRVKTDKCSFLLTSVYSAEAMVASGVLPWQLISSISRASLHAKGPIYHLACSS